MKLLDRWFAREEMDGDGRCATYLVRWTLLKAKGWSVYLHHFVGDDWSRDLHDHPKRFISIGLWGRYVEETPAPSLVRALWLNAPPAERVFRAPWIRTFPADHIHRLRLVNGRPCWTLVIVLKAVRRWGFWHQGKFVGWREYVGSEAADKMKSCS